MKIIKRLFKIVFTLFGILILIAIVTLWVDSVRTNYLNIDKNKHTSNNSYLISKII